MSFNLRVVTAMIFIAVMVAAVVMLLSPMDDFTGSAQQKQVDSAVTALNRAVVQCYALEGSYPPDLDYLSRHYGVILDEDRFYYYYEIFASNIRPTIMVLPKDGGS